MTRDHYDESLFFFFSFVVREQIAAIWIFFFFLRFVIVRGCLLFTTSMFFSLFRCFLAGCYLLRLVFPFLKRDSWLINCLERSLEECVYLSIAPIRRVAWLLFFTERSVQTCREEVEEKERDLVRLKAVF